jgi:hypothetical protein
MRKATMQYYRYTVHLFALLTKEVLLFGKQKDRATHCHLFEM